MFDSSGMVTGESFDPGSSCHILWKILFDEIFLQRAL